MLKAGVSKSTMDKMGRSEKVSLDVIDRICCSMDCDISDVIEYVSEQEW